MELSFFLSTPGAAVKLAKAISVAPSLVSQWKNGTRPIPAERCPEIERETGGAVTCEELRPDVDWAYLRGTATVNAEKQPNIESAHPAASECCAIKVQPIGDENGTFLCIAPPIAIGAVEKRAAERREIKVQETVLHQPCGNERRGES